MLPSHIDFPRVGLWIRWAFRFNGLFNQYQVVAITEEDKGADLLKWSRIEVHKDRETNHFNGLPPWKLYK